MEGKTLFALVNMWNMPGIEDHWRNTTSDYEVKEFINPIGDLDLNDF